MREITIGLYKNYKLISEFQVPEYRFGQKELFNLMRYIYVSQITTNPEETARFFVNKRRGIPPWDTNLDLMTTYSDERREIGQWLGTSQLFVTATRKFSIKQYEGTKTLWAPNDNSPEPSA